MDEVVKAFKKFKGYVLFTDEKDFFIAWTKDDKTRLPASTICAGYHGSPRPSMRWEARDVKRIDCAKPGLFRKGTMTFIGMDDRAMNVFEFKDKANLKAAEAMNEYLELYRRYGL